MEKDITMGFGAREITTELDKFRDGVPRCYVSEHNQSVCGVLSAINLKENTVHFMPSVVYNLDCSVAYINNKEPSILPLLLTKISPLPERISLQDYVDEFNKRKGEEREAMLIKGKRLIMLPEEYRRR